MTGVSSLEIERKYDVDEATPLPDWRRLPGVASIGAAEHRQLDARYLDTGTGALAAQRTALRRRTGGPDEGWHIKRAAPEGKYETHFPLRADEDSDAPTPPADVLDALSGISEGPFAVLARIRNARTAYALTDAAGGQIAEFVDDRVTAFDVARGVETSWREWELELGPAAPSDDEARDALFAAADELAVAAGARAASSGSKLARALGREG